MSDLLVPLCSFFACDLRESRILRPSLSRRFCFSTWRAFPFRNIFEKSFAGLLSAGTITPLEVKDWLFAELLLMTTEGKRVT